MTAALAWHGIHRIGVPTPFLVGDTNAYLIEDDPLTLVDAGPNWATSLVALERGLATLGHSIEELELLVVTHQHIDHLGLVPLVVERSGAQVACLDALVPYVDAFFESAERDDRLLVELMRRHGVPEPAVRALLPFFALKRQLGASFHVDRPLSDGELIELRDRRLRILHRPGHSPSDTVFHDEDRGMAFGGDHLLAAVSSNAIIAHSLRAGDERDDAANRPHALETYIQSLDATARLDLDLLLAGHGKAIRDHRALIAERMRHHEDRADRILDLVGQRPRTAYDVAEAIWGPAAATQAHLTLSEVLGHVDLLTTRRLVSEELDAGVIRLYRL